MERLTAEQARALSQEANVDTVVNEALDEILMLVGVQARSGGDRFIKYRGHGFSDSAVYGNDWPIANRKITEALEDLGYRATVRSDERQFVDLWLQVEW